MRLSIVASFFVLVCGCGHGNFGRALSGFGRAAEFTVASVGRVAAPIAERVARVAPMAARVAVTAAVLSQGGDGLDEPPDLPMPSAPTSSGSTGGDDCSQCAENETCFYEDYVCPATR